MYIQHGLQKQEQIENNLEAKLKKKNDVLIMELLHCI
jgi:hypothetical protein